MHNQIGFSEILQVENGIIFFSPEGEGLYFLEEGQREAELLAYVKKESGVLPYKAIIRAGNKIFLPPCMADDIAVYDSDTRSLQKIALDKTLAKGEGLYKFWTSIAYGDYVYFAGHYYPAIIKVNVHTLELSYLTDWAGQVEERRKLQGEPYLGIGIVQGDMALFPCCCANIILKLDLQTDETEIYEIPTDENGFNGVCFSEDTYWLTSRKGNKIILWNKSSDYVETLAVEAEEQNTENHLFRPPLMLDKRLYLFPVTVAHTYYVDTVDRKISTLAMVDEALGLEWKSEGGFSKTGGPPALAGRKIYFISGKDKVWHSYDPALKKMESFPVCIDIYGQKTIRKANAREEFCNSADEGKEVVIFEENELFSCKEFLELVDEYQDEITAVRERSGNLEKNAGQQIYDRLRL